MGNRHHKQHKHATQVEKSAEEIMVDYQEKQKKIQEILAEEAEDEKYFGKTTKKIIPEELPIFHKEKSELVNNDELLQMLNTNLPTECKKRPWVLLYNSKKHGLSIHQFYNKSVNKGPILIIIKDHQENVFGGFVSPGLIKTTKFYGKDDCFLFELIPHAAVYRSKHHNKNYAYFAIDIQHAPFTGFGMGGTVGRFALALPADFSLQEGECNDGCATFENPMIAEKHLFKIDQIEIFGFYEMEQHIDDEDHSDLPSALRKENNDELLFLKSVGYIKPTIN